MQQKPSTHHSLAKALEILMAFAPHNQEIGTVQLSEKLGYHKSTVSRLLHVLMDYGFVRQNQESKKFVLGPSVIDLSSSIQESLNDNLTQIAKPFLDRLRDETGETVVLELVSGRSAVIAYIAEGGGPIRIKGRVGDRRPAHAAAGAKAILAFSGKEKRDRFLNGNLLGLTPNTITGHERLEREMREIRERGFAIDSEEVNLGINAIGAPVYNHAGEPVAAAVIAGLSQKISWKGGSPLVALLKGTVGKISEHLYYGGDSRGENGRGKKSRPK